MDNQYRIGRFILPVCLRNCHQLLSIFFLAFVFIFTQKAFSSSGFAQAQPQTAYDAQLQIYLKNQMRRYHIPGLAIAIVRDGAVEYLNGFGIADANGNAVTPDTPFLLASVSKSMTALGIMQLVEAGKIRLEDPVQNYLPWFNVADNKVDEITVAHLLYHTSGLPESGGLEANLRPDAPDALEDGVRDLASETLQFSPGQGYEYSNLNYNLLGLLIQGVTGKRYEDYIEEEIFAPLGMKNSYTSLTAAREGGATSGYYPFFGLPVVFDRHMPYTRASLPAAGLWSSVSDLSRYLIAHLNEGKFEGVSLLSAESTNLLHQPGYMFDENQGYAMGWTSNLGFMPRNHLEATGSDLIHAGELRILFHEGDWVNYKSMAFLIPELEYGLVMLMNSNDPTVPSAFRFFAWDVTLIATGGEAQYFPPAENILDRYSRWITAGILLLLVIGLTWSQRVLRKTLIGEKIADTKVLWSVLFSILFCGLLLGYLFLKFLPDHNANLATVIRFAPDLGLSFVLISILSIALGVVSIFLLSHVIHQRREVEL